VGKITFEKGSNPEAGGGGKSLTELSMGGVAATSKKKRRKENGGENQVPERKTIKRTTKRTKATLRRHVVGTEELSCLGQVHIQVETSYKGWGTEKNGSLCVRRFRLERGVTLTSNRGGGKKKRDRGSVELNHRAGAEEYLLGGQHPRAEKNSGGLGTPFKDATVTFQPSLRAG